MEHNKNDIIKAIESHKALHCHECPYEGLANCIDVLCNNTVEFINELTEEEQKKGIAIFATPTRMAEFIKLGLAVHFGTYTDNDTVKIKDVFGAIDKITEEMPDER